MSRIGRSVALLLLGLFLVAIPQGSSASLPRKRILILFPYESNMPGFISFDNSFRSTLIASKDYQFEFYAECMDLIRFPDESYYHRLLELFREKYSDQKIDLIVADLRPSLDFLAEYSPQSFRDVPVILYEQDLRLLSEPTPLPVAAVVAGRVDMDGTLALAMRLHPDTRKVFVVSGASEFDQSLEGIARQSLRSFENQVEIQYLSKLPMDELVHRVSTLPEHSLVLYISVFRDGSGKAFKSPDALALISKQASAPIYSVAETYMGSGIVGGHLLSHPAQGARTARVALRILAGEKPENQVSYEGNGNQYIFDARELKRWGISESNLPPGSEVRYRDFSAWESYRWEIIVVASALVLQMLLISALVTSLRRQRRKDRALKRAAEEWQTTFDSTTDMMMLLDRESRIIRANAAVTSYVGLPLDKILGRHCYSIMHGTTAHSNDCPAARVLQTKEHEDAVIYDRKEDAWLFVSIDPILDDKGEIAGFAHTIKDVTERKRASEAVRASEEFNRAILASLKDNVAILDKKGRILAVNEAWEQFARQNGTRSLDGVGLGSNYLEVCRRSMQEPSDSASQALNGILAVLDGKRGAFSLEYPCDSPTDSRWFSMTVVPFRDPQGGVVISHTDISERKSAEMEAQLRREELTHVTRIVTIGELASSLAHEINQPITAILCNAEAAQRFLSGPTPDLDEVRTILDDIVQDDRRAGEVIRRLRTLVKKETPQYEPLNLNDGIWETIALVRNASFLGGVSITGELDPKLPTVQGDRVQVQQVVINLLLNATAAMKDTPPALRKLVVRTTMQDSRNVLVSVRDAGSGIDKGSMEHLFEPFYTTKVDGLGMGLSISRTIIKAHGGTIWAENNSDCGATVHFTLPLNAGEVP